MSAVRCPRCGARNAATAAWCTQCYGPLDPSGGAQAGGRDDETHGGAASGPAADGAPGVGPDDGGATSGHHRPGIEETPPMGVSPVAVGGESAGVRTREDGTVEWRCQRCDGFSPLEADRCVTCGARRTGFGEERPAGPVAPGRARRLRGWSYLLPGVAHVVTGRVGSGLARAVLAVAYLGGGLSLGVGAARHGGSPAGAVVLLLGAVIVWGATIADTEALIAGRPTERLDGRRLLWLVASVTVLLVVALLVDTLRLG